MKNLKDFKKSALNIQEMKSIAGGVFITAKQVSCYGLDGKTVVHSGSLVDCLDYASAYESTVSYCG